MRAPRKSQLPKTSLARTLVDNGIDFVVAPDGSITALADLCTVTYVNCRTHETETVTLRKGETFCYGDWDGTTCVRKVFECQ